VGGTRFPYSGTAALSAKASGGIDMVTLSLGLSFTEKLYLGVSVNRWGNGSESSARREEQATIASWTEVSDTTFSDGYEGTNVHLGALFKPSQKIRFGVVYKTPFTMDQTWDRTAETTSAVSGNATETIQRTGTIRWPATVGVGIAIMPTDSLTVSTDYTASWWSRADHYFVQTVSPAPAVERRSDDPSLRSQASVERVIWPTFYDPAFPESSTNPAQVDTQQARVGVEYMILKPRIFGVTALPVRVGVFSDQQYFKETPSFAKVTYLGISGGIGFVWSRFSLDVAYLHTQGEFFSDYSTPIETITSEQADTFRSHRLYVSTTVRF
jgi:long-subunit fatty acid transport protein